jgi:hypothetical protein
MDLSHGSRTIQDNSGQARTIQDRTSHRFF